jgi:DNA repair protein RadC
MKEIDKLLELYVFDHFKVTRNMYCSFRDEELISVSEKRIRILKF